FIIEVMDDGVGLDKDEVDKIFDRFYKGKSGGNGLGLTISKGIIEALGGNISCGNRNNGGAFFKVELKKSCALF
ncbi:MAG: sensor histidine kinase, partial [Clostridium sp.]